MKSETSFIKLRRRHQSLRHERTGELLHYVASHITIIIITIITTIITTIIIIIIIITIINIIIIIITITITITIIIIIIIIIITITITIIIIITITITIIIITTIIIINTQQVLQTVQWNPECYVLCFAFIRQSATKVAKPLLLCDRSSCPPLL